MIAWSINKSLEWLNKGLSPLILEINRSCKKKLLKSEFDVDS